MRPFFRLVAFSLVLLVPQFASATSFVIPTDEQMITRSDAIVIGTVGHASPRRGDAGASAPIETVNEVRIERGIKGPIGSGQLVPVIQPGGEIDGRGLYVPGAARFIRGERVLLFLTYHNGEWQSLDLMLGKFRFATSSRGEKVLVRDTDDEDDSATVRSLAGERVRTQEGFVRYIEDVLYARPRSDYFVSASGSVLTPQGQSLLTIEPNVAPYPAESYTQKGNSALGVRWDPATAANGISYYRRTGSGSDIGSPDPGITTAMNSWNGECGSQINERLAGTTTTPSGATNATCQICDNVNVLEFNDPQGRVGTWTGAGTIAITFITFNSVSTANVGSNFRQILDADIVFSRNYNPSIEPSYQEAITHELGHSIGFRHSNASPSNPNDSTLSCNSATEECATVAIMYWLANSALGATLQPWDVHAAQAVYPGGSCTNPPPSTRVKGDFNGDGKADILLRDTAGNLGMWLMNGAAIVSGGSVGSPGSAYSVAGIADFNADGKADILLRDTAGNIGLWIMNGMTVVNGSFVGAPGGTYTVAGVGDFNGDGRADILLRDLNGNLGVWMMNGSTITAGSFVGSPGAGYSVAGIGDFNGDGKADILLRDLNGNLGMWLMNGSTITSGASVGAPGSAYTVAGVGDFNGDGKADILLRDTAGNLGMWLMNGSTIASGASVGSPGAGYSVAAVNDYNGDGKADILLRDTAGNVGMWLMNGSAIVSGALVSAPGSAYTEY